MIFVTVGVQLPFDRLVRTVDEWALRTARSDIIAQIGQTDYRPRQIDGRATVTTDEFRQFVENSELVVAHAGMGSIITALELGKKIIVMPRRAELREHRNDHQLATARHMAEQNVVSVASDEHELVRLLDKLEPSSPVSPIQPYASDLLIRTIADHISMAPIRSKRAFWQRRG